jgi:hypothetical protein
MYTLISSDLYSIIFHHMPSYSIYLSSLPTFLSIDLSISLSIYASFVDAYVVGWFPAWIQLVFRVGSIWMDEQNGMVWSKPIRMDNWAASCIGDAAGCKICSVLIYNECAWKKYPTIYRSKSSQNICYIYIYLYIYLSALFPLKSETCKCHVSRRVTLKICTCSLRPLWGSCALCFCTSLVGL